MWAVNKLGLTRDVKEPDSSLLTGHVSRGCGDSLWFLTSALWSLLDDDEPATEAGHYPETSRSLAQCPYLWVFGGLRAMSLAAFGGQLRTSLDSLSLMSWKSVFLILATEMSLFVSKNS